LPVTVLVVLAAIYLLTGVVGHDPWKTEDAIHLGIAYGFATEGFWSVPRIAGEAWAHTAPLYHWLAALLGRTLGGILAFHDAARLATAVFGALFLLATAGAAQALFGQAAGRIAPLLAIGTLGLLTPIHDAQPAIAGLSFAAIAWWGGGLILQGHPAGGLLLGAGFGLAFPAHGLVGLMMAAAPLLAPLLRRDYKSLLLALLVALPLLLAWPLLLQKTTAGSAFLAQWWQNELAEATRARSLPTARHFEQLLWAGWPVLPLSLWSLWLHRRSPAVLALPLLGVLATLGWYLSGSPRTLSALPVLLPLSLLAAAGANRLRRGAANAFDWFALMTFSFIALLVWLGASAQALGWPPAIARNFAKLAPGHAADYSWPLLIFAAALSLAWLVLWGLRRTGWRASLHWAAGVTLMWALVATLWLSWVDHYKSYRSVAMAVQSALPEDHGCIERVNLGPAHLAVLDYFAHIRTTSPGRAGKCGWRIVIANKDREAPAGWQTVWHGGRPSDRKENWYLDKREN
jgi:4-amino-4-deoxy-L-arabinose transferase-like glycosyltransferase